MNTIEIDLIHRYKRKLSLKIKFSLNMSYEKAIHTIEIYKYQSVDLKNQEDSKVSSLTFSIYFLNSMWSNSEYGCFISAAKMVDCLDRVVYRTVHNCPILFGHSVVYSSRVVRRVGEVMNAAFGGIRLLHQAQSRGCKPAW